MIQMQENRNRNVLKLSGNFKRVVVVGDIHGCFMELQHLLTSVQFSHDDILISVGDLVNRGPYPIQTLRFFRDTPNAYLVKGNHEVRLEKLLLGEIEPSWSEKQTLTQITPKERNIWLNFLHPLPEIIVTDYTTVVHCCLDANTSIENQQTFVVTGGASKISERDDKGVPFWYRDWEKTNGAESPICIGHEAFSDVELVEKKLFALDTKVDRGKMLTGVVFPERHIVQIDAYRNYRIQSKSSYFQDLLISDPESVPLDVLEHTHKTGKTYGLLDNLSKRANIIEKLKGVAERTQRQFGENGDIDLSVLKELAKLDLKQRIRYYSLFTKEFQAQDILKLFPSNMNFRDAANIIAELSE